ncbi:MAG: hypothetical protein ACI4Q6_04700, partial [Huintestinicola sp.]
MAFDTASYAKQARMKAKKTATELVADKIYWVLRAAVIVNLVMLFFPSFNPSRLSGMINKNLSLFSCGVSYSSIVSNFGRAFRQGWLTEATFHSLNIASSLIIVAVIFAAAGGCMSLGNRKLRKTGAFVSVGAGIIEIIAFVMIRNIYNSICTQAIEAG